MAIQRATRHQWGGGERPKQLRTAAKSIAAESVSKRGYMVYIHVFIRVAMAGGMVVIVEAQMAQGDEEQGWRWAGGEGSNWSGPR